MSETGYTLEHVYEPEDVHLLARQLAAGKRAIGRFVITREQILEIVSIGLRTMPLEDLMTLVEHRRRDRRVPVPGQRKLQLVRRDEAP
jgi:hypothetical protein